MTTEAKEKTLDKVQKLHAHAESAKELGNEAFAAKIQELLTAYKLSMAEVRCPGSSSA